jgi:hypothetical protein
MLSGALRAVDPAIAASNYRVFTAQERLASYAPKGQESIAQALAVYLFSAIVGRLTAEFSARFYLFAGFRQEPALRSGECLLPN